MPATAPLQPPKPRPPAARKQPPTPKKPPAKKGTALAKAAAKPTVQQAAQAEIDPVIAAITKQANDRAAAAEAAITGLTDSYAKDLAGIDYTSPYTSAEGQQASVDDALRQQLAGTGADLSAGLSSRLQALAGTSGAPAVADTAGTLTAQGTGSGLARVASGSAALGSLIAHGAAAQEYGQKQPGIAKLAGLQGVKQAEGAAQQEIASGTTSAESRLPDIMQQIKSDRLAAANAKTEKQYKAATLALDRAKAAASIAQGNARIGIEQQNANTSAFRAQTSAAHDAALERMARANYGLSVERLRVSEQKATQARKTGGLTANEAASMRAKAADALQSYYHGVAAKYEIGADGSRVLVSGTGPGSAKTYQQAIKSLLLSYPDLGPKQVINMANKLYRPGEGGRPAGKQPNLSLILGAPGGVAPPPFVGGASLAAIKNPHERAQATTLIGLAQDYLGTPYQWGGESPKGFDCSGFAQYLYGKVGVKIPRTTYTQWQAGHPVAPGQLVPGDLVFFKGSDSVGGLPGHVGIYIGGGKMIDAPHTGSTVRIDTVSSFGGYMGARRYS